jgi:hypothetical protein
MDLNKLKELSLDKLIILQQEVENAIKNIKSTCHYEIGDVLLQKTNSCVKVFKILNKNYEEEFGWEYRINVIKFDKSNIIKFSGDFYTESFELEDIETIKVNKNIWHTLEILYNKCNKQLDKVFDDWKKKEDFIRNECMEELWKILNKEL